MCLLSLETQSEKRGLPGPLPWLTGAGGSLGSRCDAAVTSSWPQSPRCSPLHHLQDCFPFNTQPGVCVCVCCGEGEFYVPTSLAITRGPGWADSLPATPAPCLSLGTVSFYCYKIACSFYLLLSGYIQDCIRAQNHSSPSLAHCACTWVNRDVHVQALGDKIL